MTTTELLRGSSGPRFRGLRVLLGVLVPVGVLGVALGATPIGSEVAVLLPLYVLLCLLARRFPAVAVSTGLAVAIVTPIYYGRYAVGTLAVTPLIAVALVLLPVALARRQHVKLGVLDLAVGTYLVLRAVSLLVNYSTAAGALAGLVLGVLLPYVVMRLLTAGTDTGLLAGVVLGSGAVLSLVAIGERSGIANPFFTLLPVTYQADLARSQERLGALRAEASFGDPISFGMFLALALVLGVCLSLTARTVRRRLLATAATGLVLIGLAATQSRGALLVALVGTAAWLLLTRRLDVLRLAALVGAVAIVAVTTPVLGTVLALKDQSSGDTREARSATYRLEILSVARDPGSFSLLGQETDDTGGVTLSVSDRVGLKSLDSEFALVYFASGLLGFLAFTAVVVLVLRVGLLRRLSPLERAWALGVGASYLNLLTVALFTQQAGLLWGWTALTASLAQRAAHVLNQSHQAQPYQDQPHEERFSRWTP